MNNVPLGKLVAGQLGFFADRPWDVGNSPKTSVRAWLLDNQASLPNTPDFEIDRAMVTKLQVTMAPDGFLRRQ